MSDKKVYDSNKLPDFFSVRNYEQIDYSMEGMSGKKCYCFLIMASLQTL